MNSWAVASFSEVTSRLVLSTRGKEKTEVFRALIRELYLHATLTHPTPEWRLSTNDKKDLDKKLRSHLAMIEA